MWDDAVRLFKVGYSSHMNGVWSLWYCYYERPITVDALQQWLLPRNAGFQKRYIFGPPTSGVYYIYPQQTKWWRTSYLKTSVHNSFLDYVPRTYNSHIYWYRTWYILSNDVIGIAGELDTQGTWSWRPGRFPGLSWGRASLDPSMIWPPWPDSGYSPRYCGTDRNEN